MSVCRNYSWWKGASLVELEHSSELIPHRFGLTIFNMALSDFPSDNWDAATPADVKAALGKATSLPHPQHRELANRTYLLPESPGLPLLAFSTSDGAQGLLQITGFTANPRRREAPLQTGAVKRHNRFKIKKNTKIFHCAPSGCNKCVSR